MKTLNFSAIMLLLSMLGFQAQATKWRVNNTGLQANFTTAQEVVNASQVASGDTIYFEPSTWSYGNMLGITKKLVIIGPGYFLGENDSTQADKKTARLGQAQFVNGSQGSVIKGMYVEGSLQIQSTGDILVERNWIEGVDINYGCIKLIIIRNYVKNIGVQNANHILISNNIIVYDGWCFNVTSSASAVVTNNVVAGYMNINNSTVNNNICLSTASNSFVHSNVSDGYNIGAGTQFGTANGNQSNVDMNNVFTFSASSDGRYQLKSGSTAIGAGFGGTDCGAFGGDYPYVLSGMVTGPSVYDLNMSGTEVTVKAKSH
ncbi:MAG TPA: hypothetical protein PLK82_00885 [Bacteroidales bacterium]|nr:hypothetical protein [Bacteroidales bacterium]